MASDKDDRGLDLNVFSFASAESQLDTHEKTTLDPNLKGGPVFLARDSSMPPDPFDENLIGTVIAGHFEILSKIGEGGMSVVYLARHQLMNKRVAIKMLHPHMVGSKQSRDRFRQEAQAVSQIDHRNVVRILDFGITSSNRPYIVMDFLDGSALADVIKDSGPLEIERAIPLFIELAEALEFAHGKGVVHRDLKPSNVILVKNEDYSSEQPKIVDFGIAKLLPHEGADAAALTQTGDVFGSPLYMSPEQCKGEKLDGRADIYSMGCLMYETLTGKPPINGANMLEILYRHMNEMPPPMKTACPSNPVPQRIEAIIFKALAKEQGDRQQSMRQLREELQEYQNSQDGPLSFIRSGWSLYRSRQKRISTREKLSVAVSAAALLALLGCGTSLVLLYNYGQEQGKDTRPVDWFIQFADRKVSPAVVNTSTVGTECVLDKARSRVQKIRHMEHGGPISARDELDDPNSDLQQILKVGEAAYRSLLFHEAAEIYENAYEISRFENGPDAITTREAAFALFRCYYYSGDYGRAITQIEHALNTWDHDLGSNNSMRTKASLLSCLGDCYYRTGNYDAARKYLYQAVEAWRAVGPREGNYQDQSVRELKALCFSRFGDVFMQLKMPDSAIKYYDQARVVWSEALNERQRVYNVALVAYKKSLAEFNMHKYEEADKNFNLAIKQLKKRPADELYHRTVISMYQQAASDQKQSNLLIASVQNSIQAGLSKYFSEAKEADSQ
jgi:serine/threonine protein kinase